MIWVLLEPHQLLLLKWQACLVSGNGTRECICFGALTIIMTCTWYIFIMVYSHYIMRYLWTNFDLRMGPGERPFSVEKEGVHGCGWMDVFNKFRADLSLGFWYFYCKNGNGNILWWQSTSTAKFIVISLEAAEWSCSGPLCRTDRLEPASFGSRARGAEIWVVVAMENTTRLNDSYGLFSLVCLPCLVDSRYTWTKRNTLEAHARTHAHTNDVWSVMSSS